jgi:hypothetical protein
MTEPRSEIKKIGSARRALIIEDGEASTSLREEINLWKDMLQDEYKFDQDDILTLVIKTNVTEYLEQKFSEFLNCQPGDSLLLIYVSSQEINDSELVDTIIRSDLTKLPRRSKFTAIIDAYTSPIPPFKLTYGLRSNISSYDLTIREKGVQADVTCFMRDGIVGFTPGKLLTSMRHAIQINDYEFTFPSLLSQIKGCNLYIWFSRIKSLDASFDFI